VTMESDSHGLPISHKFNALLPGAFGTRRSSTLNNNAELCSTFSSLFCHLTDINECSKGSDTCNKTSSVCVDSDGNFWCDCKEGYTRGANNKLCEGTLFTTVANLFWMIRRVRGR